MAAVELSWKTFSLDRLDELGYARAMVKIPPGNPWTAAKAELGRHLFFDRRLSKDHTISCASCHDPGHGWADRSRFSAGLNGQRGRRNSPTLVNRIFSREQFWDGRAGSREEQAAVPISSVKEMGESHRALVAKIAQISGYRELFSRAYGDERVDLSRITSAIGSFERTILVYDSPWQRWEAGDTEALGDSALRGLEIFKDNSRGRCSVCHSGPHLSDEKFHNTGVGTGGGAPASPAPALPPCARSSRARASSASATAASARASSSAFRVCCCLRSTARPGPGRRRATPRPPSPSRSSTRTRTATSPSTSRSA